jgi:N-acetylneuraminic acid mutarotase
MKWPSISFLLLCLAATLPARAQDDLAWASGSWFNPNRNYEGFVVQVLPDNIAVVTWFTYPPEGEEGEQAWMIGTGRTEGERVIVDEMLRPVGATFGPDFDPEDVSREPWGTLEITFADCNTALAEYQGPQAFGSGSTDLVRLTAIDDVECDASTVPDPDRIVAGRSGLWYDPNHDGEGWMIEVLTEGTVLVYWFTYDDQGRQVWLIGQARAFGKTLWIEDMLITRGTRFGDAFNSEDVELIPWGDFGFLFEDCRNARMRYASGDQRFGEGTLVPKRLAFLADTECVEQAPAAAPLSAGSWRFAADLGVAVTETASAAAGDYAYTAGGHGHYDRLSRFDLAANSWQSMPPMPGARHHPIMTSDGERIYVAGGYSQRYGAEVAHDNFWRFDPALGSWEDLSPLPQSRAAGDAVFMHGKIWIVGGEGQGGSMLAYDVVTGEWSLFPSDVRALRDHMQAVAFENEIWWIGGRTDSSTSNRVLIWNPVTQEWREGPSLFYARSGFSAAVVQGQILVTAGERIDLMPAQLIPSLEVFAPGSDGWVQGPSPPILVHGTTGASVNGRLVITAGSDIAGSLSDNRATQIYEPAEN